MAEHTTYTCDLCGATCGRFDHYFQLTGKDPVTTCVVWMGTEGYKPSEHLCRKCAKDILARIVKEYPQDET